MSYLIPEQKLFVDASGDVSIPGHLTVESISATSLSVTGDITTIGNITTTGAISSTSTTTGFLPPVLTTSQRNAIVFPVTGLEIFNSTTNQPEFYNGSIWAAVGGVSTLNTLVGAITLAAGSNISITPSGNILTISATASVVTYQQDLFPWVGSNVFTLSFTPISNSQIVFFNGLGLVSGASHDYVLSGTTLTLNAGIILKAGDQILVVYPH